MSIMNQLSTVERAKVVSVLVEGNSLRGTARITDVARMTIEKLLRDLGSACARHHDETVRGLKCQRIQCDEIWSFVGAKQKNVPAEKLGEWGDLWTWTGIDADTKLIVSYLIGPRTPPMAYEFMKDLASRVAGHTQLTTDGLHWYVDAVDHAFGIDVDYAMLQKHYGKGPTADANAATRYSPSSFTGATREIVKGRPDPRHISTSYVERQNLTMRMHMRRFTRLTNGFSKKIEMHAHSVALHFAYYNFCKIHQTLRVTPAMEAGLTDHVWSVEELIGLLATTTSQRASA
jgi:IS1 family transposase